MIALQQFKKQYGEYTVLDIPSFVLDKGLYWLKGENGSGKSTLLKSLAGIIPFEGNLSIDAHNLKKERKAYLREINYGEAEPVYPAFLTGKELLGFFRETKKGNGKDSDYLVEKLHMGDAMERKTGTYSSGMLKKLSLILAFCGHPQWILLDEPLITLDVASVSVMLEEIHSSIQEGISFLLTSHQDMDFPENNMVMQSLYLYNKTLNRQS